MILYLIPFSRAPEPSTIQVIKPMYNPQLPLISNVAAFKAKASVAVTVAKQFIFP
jgi:hypothetical protein